MTFVSKFEIYLHKIFSKINKFDYNSICRKCKEEAENIICKKYIIININAESIK